jgi:endonuclease/exonuclease/phosphatase family metal-dependent hydrolase
VTTTTWLFLTSACSMLALAMIARSVESSEGGPRLAAVPAPDPAGAMPPIAPGPGQLRILTWNVAHGRGTAFHQALLRPATIRANLTSIGEVLQREQADVVALQEVDGPSVWSGEINQSQLLAEAVGFSHRVRGGHGRSVGPVALDYGTALIAQRQLEAPRSVRFEESWRDNKGFVVASVELPGTGRSVDVVSLHLDFLDPALRQRQVERLIAELRGRQRPLIVVGDFNCGLHGRSALRTLTRALQLRPAPDHGQATFPAPDPRRRLDWVLVSPELEVVASRTLPDVLSDHRAVVADIELKNHADNQRREP